ncbi:MAG: sensor histidine kinase [Rhodanobacteraceae bacterium]|jgi:two-component system sensor histidine kinase DesK|nr:sensor histidine kinase [Rhodanobacteraceae bacterium]
MPSILAHLRNLRATLPDERGWAPLWSLLYLGFLFMNWNGAPLHVWLPPTLLSIAVFLPLYLRAVACSSGRTRVLAHVAAIALLGFALIPVNTSANTYLIYAAALLPLSGIRLSNTMALIAAGIALIGLEAVLLGWPLRYVVVVVGVTGIVATAIGAANHFHREKRLRQAELKLSHDEVRRLAALAERERIGRDLHDLLGHTLSLITLKSELAMRLFDRDPLAARREIADVERVARDALGQVRRAVTGIRSAGLAAELASARLLLESSDVRLDYTLTADALPPEIETVFALTVREAVTNIQRHAHATHAHVDVWAGNGAVRLRVADDGRGASIVPGNGLNGMRERLQALGGQLRIESERGRGTRLIAELPLPPDAAAGVLGWNPPHA